MSVAALEPQAVWRLFAELSAIPRPSHGEERVLAWLRAWADAHGLEHAADAIGNTVIRVPATTGREGAPTLILQAHVDMVCERTPDAPRDPATDGVEPYVDGEWVRARGTTLGADDGIGVVAALAAAVDPDAPHGPLELLLTVAEEVGMAGVRALDPALVRGRLLLNLDSEEDGALVIGCSGGTDTRVALDAPRAPVAGPALRVAVAGGRGGHSGVDALLGRLNANQALGRVLATAHATGAFRLASVTGGRSRNAIPRDAEAIVVGADPAALVAAFAPLREAVATTDPDVALVVEPVATPADAWTDEASARVVALLASHPSGVLAMSPAVPGLAETSTSIGVVTTDGGRLELKSLARSSNDAGLAAHLQTLAALADLAGATLTTEHGYGGWQPDPSSALLAAARVAYGEALGGAPHVGGMHAGLEPAVIGGLIPGLDMLSMGPTIESPHSPDERLSIPAVERFWRLLRATLDVVSR